MIFLLHKGDTKFTQLEKISVQEMITRINHDDIRKIEKCHLLCYKSIDTGNNFSVFI